MITQRNYLKMECAELIEKVFTFKCVYDRIQIYNNNKVQKLECNRGEMVMLKILFKIIILPFKIVLLPLKIIWKILIG
jgi:hypothetical protein